MMRHRFLINVFLIFALFLSVTLIFSKTIQAAEMWSQTYGETGWEGANSLIQTSDGGYAVACYYEPEDGDGDFWLVKLDKFGNMEWNQTYGGADSEEAYSLVETSDGGYTIAGTTRSFGAGGADFWLVRTDAFGNMLCARAGFT